MSNVNNKKSNNFSKWFWGTILVLVIVYIGMILIGQNRIKNMTPEEKKVLSKELIVKLHNKYPQIFQLITKMNAKSKQEIKELVEKEVNEAYAPLYNNIDKFVDFHYSVKGEYSEIFSMLAGKIGESLNEYIFKPANFDERLNSAVNNINSGVIKIIRNNFENMKDDIKNKLDISNNEVNFLLNDVLKISFEDTKSRFQNYTSYLIRGSGILAGGLGGAMLVKIISKKLAKKIILKTGSKLALKAAGGAGGAVTGAEAGLICGPAAEICSPVGAVLGGIVAWFGTDKIFIEVDKYFNAQDFRKEIKYMIDEQKRRTIINLENIYLKSFEITNKNNINKIKQKTNLEITKDL